MTHYVDSDRIPDRRGNVRAVCGQLVNEQHGETDDQQPTCPRCAAWLQQHEDESLPAWATEKWSAR